MKENTIIPDGFPVKYLDPVPVPDRVTARPKRLIFYTVWFGDSHNGQGGYLQSSSGYRSGPLQNLEY